MRLRVLPRKAPGLPDLPALESLMEDLCFRSSDVLPLFNRLYEEEFEAYSCKREVLLRSHPISELFKQLEMTEHFTRFKRLRPLK